MTTSSTTICKKFRTICDRLCVKPEDYGKRASVLRHNRAMDQLYKLTDSISKNDILTVTVFKELLDDSDVTTRYYAAIHAHRLGVLTENSERIVESVAQSKVYDERLLASEAQMLL